MRGFFNDNFKIEIAMLVGIFAFFLGGMIGLKNNITTIIIYAAITGIFGFFLAYFIIEATISKKVNKINDSDKTENIKNTINKGKKIDITVDNKNENM